MRKRPSARLRFLLQVAALPVIASLGTAVAASIPTAHAGLIPTLPTVTVPTLPVTLPALPTVTDITLGTTTVGAPVPTTTAAALTTTSASSGAGQGSAPGAGGPTHGSDVAAVVTDAVAGAVRLRSGAVSVSVSSVRAPALLVFNRITVAPKWISARGQRLRIVARISDSRGYLVRGASVDIQTLPGGRVKPVGVHTTRADGTVSLLLTTSSSIPMRRGSKLTLVIRAYQGRAATSTAKVVRRVISLPIRPR